MKLATLRAHGVPNYFGPQRFGREGRNLDGVADWLERGVKPLGRTERGFVLSSARSLIFNAVLARRVEDASWGGLQPGDLLLRIGDSPTNVRYDEQMPDFMRLVTSLPLDKEVTAVVLRAGSETNFHLKPIERGEINPPEKELKQWGLTARDLETLQHYFYKTDVAAAEFRSVSTPLLTRSPWQSTFGWLPRVTLARREAFESTEAGLGGKVEVMFLPETYNARGFQGVIGEIRKKHPGVRLHTLHGTDFGGMLVRFICDECGWIYPWCILRRDNVSATAIRRGAKGMTLPVVTDVLDQISRNLPEVAAGGRRFRNDNGVLAEGIRE